MDKYKAVKRKHRERALASLLVQAMQHKKRGEKVPLHIQHHIEASKESLKSEDKIELSPHEGTPPEGSLTKLQSESERKGIKPKDVDPKQLEEGSDDESHEHGLDEQTAQGIALDHLAEDPNYYKAEGVGMPRTIQPVKPHHHVVLPVGSQIDGPGPGGAASHRKVGTIKVIGANGQAKWVEVRDGIIRSPRNPQGHTNPISSAIKRVDN